ncbi:MAG: hypothetical protein AB7S26_01595 [Sandaracinaceae bacterium]
MSDVRILTVTAPLGAILFAIASLTIAPSARADACEDALDRAYQLREGGQDEAARQLLVQTYERCPQPKVLAMLGLAEAAVNRWAESYAHLTEALRSDHEWIERNRADLDSVRTRALGNLGLLEVRGPDGARVAVDGESHGTLPLREPIPLAPGRRVLTVTRSDGTTYVRERQVTAGARWNETVPDHDEASAAAASGDGASPAASGGDGGSVEVGAIVLIALGGAIAVGGGVMLGVGQADVAAIEGSERGTYWPDVADAADRALILSDVGIAALAVGGAALIGGVLWLTLGAGGSEAERAALQGRFVF